MGLAVTWASARVQSRAPARAGSGVHASDEMVPWPMVIVMLWLLLPRDAMIWNEEPAALGAVTENVALVLPAGTATDAGSTRPVLLAGEVRVIVEFPPALDRTTVQVVVPPGGRVVSAQVREEMAGDACKVKVVACDALPRLAVRLAGSSDVGEPAIAEKDAVLEPDGTVTVAGAVRSGLVLASSSVTPPAPAAFVKVTVQPAVAPAARMVGLQTSEEMPMGAAFSVKLRVEPFSVAVSTAELAFGAELTVAVKLALPDPEGTFTAAGTFTSGVPVSDTDTASLPTVRLRVTVQLSWAPGFKVAGLHAREVSVGGPNRVTVTILDTIPSVTVTLAV